MARGSYFANMFGSSPVSPMQLQMAKVQECVAELVPFLDAVLDGNWKKAEKIQQRIARREGEADDLKRELRLQLPKGLFMPVSRRDMLEVLTMQDRLANKAKDIAGLMLGRQMEIPKGLGGRFRKFLLRSIDAAQQAQVVINELDELVEAGFRGGEVKVVQQMIKKLDKLEGDTDDIQVELRSALFKKEQDLPPVDVMFLYRIIDWIGDLADIAQRVGSRLEVMLAR
ncbi:MAG: TIGR00153 family protein [Pseudomonadota bacterium]|nr:MAG: TIGR00153 family protein [Pseudomonadota bacterium]